MKTPMIIGGGAVAVVVVAAGLYFGLSGSGSGPSNATARAEQAMASLKEAGGTYSYKSAESSGRGVVMKNVAIKAPATSPAQFSMTIAEMRINDMDWTNAKSPDFADIDYRGVRFEGTGAEPAQLRDFKDATGVKDLVVNIRAAYAFNKSSRTLEIKTGDVELVNFGTLSFTAKLDGIDKDKISGLNTGQPDPSQMMAAFASLRIVSLRIAFKDAGGTNRAFDAAAKKQGLASGEALREMALKSIADKKKSAPFKIAQQLSDATEKFVRKPGTIEIAANPRTPFAVMSLSAVFMGGPNPAAIDKLTEELGLSVAAK